MRTPRPHGNPRPAVAVGRCAKLSRAWCPNNNSKPKGRFGTNNKYTLTSALKPRDRASGEWGKSLVQGPRREESRAVSFPAPNLCAVLDLPLVCPVYPRREKSSAWKSFGRTFGASLQQQYAFGKKIIDRNWRLGYQTERFDIVCKLNFRMASIFYRTHCVCHHPVFPGVYLLSNNLSNRFVII